MNERQKFEAMAGQVDFLLEFLHLETEQSLSPMVLHHLSELGKMAKTSNAVNGDAVDFHLETIVKKSKETK